jgi:hypothetical protein
MTSPFKKPLAKKPYHPPKTEEGKKNLSRAQKENWALFQLKGKLGNINALREVIPQFMVDDLNLAHQAAINYILAQQKNRKLKGKNITCQCLLG